MKIAVWRTGHEIADTVACAIEAYRGYEIWHCDTKQDIPTVVRNADVDCHIGYGILRGMDEVFRECDRQGKPWFNVDRGYFNPGHYDGYYRISLCGTQQTIGLDKLESDGKRFEALGIKFEEGWYDPNGHTLIVPPTGYVNDYFAIYGDFDMRHNIAHGFSMYEGNYLLREKGCARSLQQDLKNCLRIITFNSSIGWEALRLGIPVYSDPIHSIVGAYQKIIDKPLYLDNTARRKLFAVMGDLQMTLEEIRNGRLCTILPKLIKLYNPAIHSTSILGGTQEKPSPVTWPRTA